MILRSVVMGFESPVGGLTILLLDAMAVGRGRGGGGVKTTEELEEEEDHDENNKNMRTRNGRMSIRRKRGD